MCTKFLLKMLKNDRVLVFRRSKTIIFHANRWELFSFPIFKFCPIGAFKKYSRVIFRVPDDNWPKTFITPPKHKIFIWAFTSWPWMTLILNMFTESFRWHVEVSQKRSTLFCVISIWYDCNARQNQIRQIVKHFHFDLAFDVIGDSEVNSFRFPSTHFLRSIERLLNFVNRTSSSWVLGGAKNSPTPCRSYYGNTLSGKG